MMTHPNLLRKATAFVVLFATRNRDMIKATAHGMGRDWRQVVYIVDRMARDERAEFCCLVIPRSVPGSDDYRPGGRGLELGHESAARPVIRTAAG
jgi:hypothetical protein